MRHRQQLQLAVEHAKNLVRFEADGIDVKTHALVARGVAKAQIAIIRPQRQKMPQQLRAMFRPDRANRDDRCGQTPSARRDGRRAASGLQGSGLGG
jgi:hypothetical protein